MRITRTTYKITNDVSVELVYSYEGQTVVSRVDKNGFHITETHQDNVDDPQNTFMKGVSAVLDCFPKSEVTVEEV